MSKFCENQLCESEAFKVVPVSEKKAGDSKRSFCAPCEESYTIGVQHGTKRTEAEIIDACEQGRLDEYLRGLRAMHGCR